MVDPFTLLEAAPWATPLIGALVGVLLAITPLAWPLAITTVATSVAAGDDRLGARHAAVAVGVGITVVYVALGIGVGSIDWLVRDVLGAGAGVALAILGGLAVASGAVLLWRPAAACRLRDRAPRTTTAGGVALGAVLAVVTCPACAGIVTGVAVTAAAGWGPVSAAGAMLGLGIGHTIALVAMTGLATRRGVAVHHLTTAQRVAGAVLVLAGLAFAWQASQTGLSVAPTLP